MTAQINDRFRHDGIEFSVAGISEGELFDPAVLDLKPSMASTACWRGYQVVYSVLDRHLVVANLHVKLLEEEVDGYIRKEGPPINGVSPTGPAEGYDFFNNHYEGINYHLEYTGGLLLAHGFIEQLYVHMGFHPAWKYERVIELLFENGVLVNEFDHSERMAEIREMILESRTGEEDREMPTRDEIRAFVERAFDRKYRL
ncbi:MAG: hypothetical protein H6822_25510 [Planctomycetaceae bacterium]|nr:hypothetical protein [Planctomycetaceae bacterium]